jgi:hypothetical protein
MMVVAGSWTLRLVREVLVVVLHEVLVLLLLWRRLVLLRDLSILHKLLLLSGYQSL